MFKLSMEFIAYTSSTLMLLVVKGWLAPKPWSCGGYRECVEFMSLFAVAVSFPFLEGRLLVLDGVSQYLTHLVSLCDPSTPQYVSIGRD